MAAWKVIFIYSFLYITKKVFFNSLMSRVYLLLYGNQGLVIWGENQLTGFYKTISKVSFLQICVSSQAFVYKNSF